MSGPQNAVVAHGSSIADPDLCFAAQEWYSRGEQYALKQDYLKALRCFEEASILSATHEESLVYQIVCWLHLDSPDKALAIADKLLGQNSTYARGWLFRGVALHRLGRYAEAYSSYDQACNQSSRP
jgi:tetratricopeptide (TPR) repeat protein